MNTQALRTLLWIALALLLFPVRGFAQEEPDILKTGKRLHVEERRQIDAGRRMKTIASNINWLVEELKSNGLSEEGGGEKLALSAGGLNKLSRGNVPVATTYLRDARGDLKKALPHIIGADKEIGTILAELDKIITGANTVLVDDLLLKQLRAIISA